MSVVLAGFNGQVVMLLLLCGVEGLEAWEVARLKRIRPRRSSN